MSQENMSEPLKKALTAMQTANGLNQYEQHLGFESKDLGSLILDLGSGELLNFARDINELYGEEKTVVSLNPHAGIKGSVGYNFLSAYLKMGKLDNLKSMKYLVAGLAQNLPFEDNTFDNVLALNSVPMWLPDNPIDLELTLSEAIRVTKFGGQIRIGPFHLENPPYDIMEICRKVCEDMKVKYEIIEALAEIGSGMKTSYKLIPVLVINV